MFPTAWKIARVTPLFKSGDRTDINNFRPISILSVLSKIAEKVVSIQLASSTHRANRRRSRRVADDNRPQQNVRQRRPRRPREARMVRCAVNRLVPELPQRATVSGGSTILPLTQVSILRPILFLVLMNDLSLSLPHGRLLSHADDTQLLDHSLPYPISLSALRARIEESIQHLQNWFQGNGLKMNPDKTDFAVIGTQASLKRAGSFRISISGSTITPSPTIKVLGVLLDRHLSWDAHCPW